jgi:ferrous iron transport protein B
MSDCHSPAPMSAGDRQALINNKNKTIALAGQPNMGKSTLFNLLTGLNQHVGNWPGKTVEQRSGVFNFEGQQLNLIDLPGTYSLTANSPEEVIAREYILREKPAAVIAVVSAANLERSLYLVSELVSLPVPVVVALNMMDVAKHEGVRVDALALESALNIPVVAVTATKALGVKELLHVTTELMKSPEHCQPNPPELPAEIERERASIEPLIKGQIPANYPVDWAALKLLEGDVEITKLVKSSLSEKEWKKLDKVLAKNDDAMVQIASSRYEWVGRLIRSSVIRPKIGQIGLTERLDRFATHPVWGLVLLAMILGFVFWLTFAIGAPIQKWLDVNLVVRSAAWVKSALSGAPGWLSGLLADGIIKGVGSVLTFLPILIIFFASFGFLEDIGYMARAAYVMDNIMHMMGLHGKSFLPLFLGFGCNVPAVMGTRVIDSWPARLLTILIAPLIPCTARMAVIAFLAPVFFGSKALFVTWGLVLFSLLLMVVMGVLLNKVIFKGERSAFIMEMPLYHIPNLRTVGLLVWQRSLSFLKKASTVILSISALIWALSYFPGGDLNTSYLAQLGKFIEPAGKFLGFDWRMTVALLTSFPAKENAVATLGVLFGGASNAGLTQTLAATYSPASALSFLVVTMLFIPCVATIAVIKQETGSWKWPLISIGMYLLLSTLSGVLVYRLALAVGV